VTELRECDDEEEADDCEDPDFPGSKADFWLDLGAGLFDSRTAKTLGIRPETLGGAMFLGLEGIDGGPASVRRRGADYRGFTYLDIFTEAAPVPEPGLLFLGAVAAGGWMARRRRPDR
jgi:hypothetical protein